MDSKIAINAASAPPGVEALTGHPAVLRQTLSLWALLALSYSNMSVWTAIGGSLSAVFTAGGPVVMVWSWIGVSVVSLMIAASLAELCSAWPHAAGQAFWAYQLSPPKWAAFISYWTALFNIYGAWAILAAGSYIQASEILGMATAWHPEYEQKPSHLVGVYLGILALAFICNVFAVRVFDAATKVAAGASIASILAIIIALSVATPIKQEARWVFTHFENTTGWSSTGLVVLLGLLQSSFTIIGYDAAAHLCEECADAASLAPLAVFWGVAISAVAGFVFILALLFSIADVDGVLTTFTGSPLMQIFLDSLGLSGATFCMFLNIFSLFLAITGILCASSRNVYAQARDDGLPFGSILGKVHPTLAVPIPALLLNCVVPAVLACIYLGSQVIFLTFFQLTTIGYLASYFVPIALLLFGGRDKLPPAPWRLSDGVAKVCNVVSLVYIIFITVMFCFPNFYPVTSANMNYTSVIGAVFVFMGAAGWFGYVRKNYKGPGLGFEV